MSLAEVTSTAKGMAVSGAISFENVMCLRQQGADLINAASHASIPVDLSGILSSDVSGLSLLVRWMHYAKSQGKALQFLKIPAMLVEIANICHMNRILGL
jgi:ABC-type transporter Mla MlaB component